MRIKIREVETMDVNKVAPVVAAGEIEVAADPEIVWDVMAGIDRWPAWNPDAKSAHLEGVLSEAAMSYREVMSRGRSMATSDYVLDEIITTL